ncbi:MAG: DMT family transporter [Desulfovibrionaceae bacterium]|nr:DMT family transporter [Desulfovibrionaceae bacterium]
MNALSGNTRNTVIGYLMVFGAALAFSMIGPIGRYPLAQGVEPLECAFWRATFGGIFFGIHGILIGAWRITPKQRAVFSLFGIPGVAMLFFSYMFAVQEAGAATTSVLNNTAPIWVAVWSYLFFKESMGGSKIFAILLAIAGASMIALSGGGLPEGGSTIGIISAVASGFLFSLHSVIGKKYLSANISSVSLYMHILPVGALCIFPFVDFMPDKNMETWIALIALGLVCNWGAYLCFCAGLKRLPATRVAVFETACEPFLAAVFSFIWWGEAFTLIGGFGAVLVIGAVVMIISIKDKPRLPEKQTVLQHESSDERRSA